MIKYIYEVMNLVLFLFYSYVFEMSFKAKLCGLLYI